MDMSKKFASTTRCQTVTNGWYVRSVKRKLWALDTPFYRETDPRGKCDYKTKAGQRKLADEFGDYFTLYISSGLVKNLCG